MKDKHILITGGSSGIGLYTAKKCVAEGANVIITGRNEEKLKDAVLKIGDKCSYIVHDITNIESLPQLFENAEKIFSHKIDSLVSNAGVSFHEGSFRNVTPDGWDKQMDTNLKGNYFIVKEFVKYLESKEDTSGNIVVITSERSMRADDIPYGLTKAATNSFIKGIARKVVSENIRINGVGPGVTESNMTGFSRDENMYAEWQSGKRIYLPEEMAEVIGFLLSDVSACISGEIIVCDQARYVSTW